MFFKVLWISNHNICKLLLFSRVPSAVFLTQSCANLSNPTNKQRDTKIYIFLIQTAKSMKRSTLASHNQRISEFTATLCLHSLTGSVWSFHGQTNSSPPAGATWVCGTTGNFPSSTLAHTDRSSWHDLFTRENLLPFKVQHHTALSLTHGTFCSCRNWGVSWGWGFCPVQKLERCSRCTKLGWVLTRRAHFVVDFILPMPWPDLIK